VVLGEECSRAKPFPDPYQRGLELLGLQPHEAIVIEDSPAGLASAVAAGIPAVRGGGAASPPARCLLLAARRRCVGRQLAPAP
jgi:beta-phosphoglucomutase-like phosphatase (HAD superfamily)